MDRESFFALLTDEAAQPDAAFIKGLRKQIIKTSSGGGGPLGGNPTLILAGVVSSAILGIGGFLFTQSDTATNNAQPTSVPAEVVNPQNTTSNQNNSALDDTEPSDEAGDEQVSQDNSDSDPQASGDLNVSGDPSQSQDDPANNATPPETQLPEDTPFTVSFWNLGAFKGSQPPVMQDDTPDLVLVTGHTLDFDWAAESPDVTINTNYFIARAEATKNLAPGDYTINMTIDDGVRIYINNQLIYDRWSVYTGVVDTASFTVGSEPKTDIRIEYFEHTDTAILKAVVSKD